MQTTGFTNGELEYLRGGERRLARLATVGPDGTPHVAPVGFAYDPGEATIDIAGLALERTKKFRDVQRNDRVALVVDDVLPPWRPRGVEVRGRAAAIGGPEARIRVHPERIVSWGIESSELGAFHARSVERGS